MCVLLARVSDLTPTPAAEANSAAAPDTVKRHHQQIAPAPLQRPGARPKEQHSMSTQQRNHACLVAVDPSTADILRRQTLIVLEANHYFFEELLEFGAEAQFALSVIYRDAFAVLDAIGWSPNPYAGTVDVPLTDGHIDQLRRCGHDLRVTNINRCDQFDMATNQEAAAIRADLNVDLAAAQILDRLFSDYARATCD
ncbi:hypothetical protein [Baekduia sp. Peel2402]|uniref:hypothetical protein n=1 Tax=Baekduia sp. Peel2402 TaxID=3458296 RepID=UPI00403E6183